MTTVAEARSDVRAARHALFDLEQKRRDELLKGRNVERFAEPIAQARAALHQAHDALHAAMQESP